MKWLEISLQLDSEWVEPVAELLTRYAPQGAVITPLDSTFDTFEVQEPLLVRAYLPEDEELAERRRKIEEGLWHLSQIQPLPAPEFRSLEQEDWSETWKRNYRPLPVGDRLLIQPAWLPSSRREGRLTLLMDPGMAFGTGTHPTTRLCLLALEELVSPGQLVIDLGCGSGLLAIAAARLGAQTVLAYDTDPLAVEIARQNAILNQVGGQVQTIHGSLPDILAAGSPADVLVANILASVLGEMLAEGMARSVKEDGWLILSGILAEQLGTVQDAAAAQGLSHHRTLRESEWRALILQRKLPS